MSKIRRGGAAASKKTEANKEKESWNAARASALSLASN